ncbi:hypothetical protein SAMN05446635_5411 [Burkholderia sp. OK233]|nr:hypothetical protein SAMN05446635_5411 [Burkholderia sp. OK233]
MRWFCELSRARTPQCLPGTIRPHNIVAEADLFVSVRNKAVLVGRGVNATTRAC